METGDFRDTLENKRLELIAGLHLERTFMFDYLRTKSVFDGGDCELICAERTREQKAGKFLDILSTKGEEGYRHFIDAIQLSNPMLFEQITGEKANMKPNPIMSVLKSGSIENYIPDLDIMTSHLQRAYTDLNDLTLSYQKMSQEKKLLEKNLIDAKSNLQALQNRVEELEKEKSNTTSDVISSLSSVKSEKESAIQQMQTLHRDLQERNTYIIALHMHLLTAQEENGNLKNRLHSAEEAKQKMHAELNLVAINYDHQRHESIKLSEKLEFHKNDLQNYTELKMNFRELQFNNQKLKHEREEVVNELNSLKEWIEVFKARYDIVERDSEQTRESHETIAADCYQLRQRIDELELKLGTQGRGLEATKKRYSETIDEIKQLKEQRDILSESRKDLMLERDQSIAELDQSKQRYTEILKNRDDTITRQNGLCKHYEEKYENACTELQWLQEQLTCKEHELEELRKAKFERELSSEQTSCPPQLPKLDLSGIHEALKTFDEELITSGDSSPEESRDSEDSYDWKYRKTTNIIESLKKRVGKDRKEDQSPSLPSSFHLNCKSPDRILEELVPQKKALSPEAQKCLSMERNNNLFKITPTHSSLACMFDSIATRTSGVRDTNFYPTSSNSVTPRNDNATYSRKALSDSDAPTTDTYLETKTKSETWHSSVKTPAYYPSLSSGSGSTRPVLTKSLTEPPPDSMSRDVFTFIHMGLPKENESCDLETALMSPSLKKPFRQRAMAIKLKDNERPRSVSAPPESPCA